MGAIAKVRDDFASTHPSILLARVAMAPLPRNTGARVRTRILRALGFDVHPTAVFADMPMIRGARDVLDLLSIGAGSFLNVGCLLDVHARIEIGERVAMAQQVALLTAGHEIGGPELRWGPHSIAPITIGSGSWLGARVTVLPGVTIGTGVIVASGAVVNKDVPPNVLVAGVPARVVRDLPV